MMCCETKIFKSYCEWLFSVLERLENKICGELVNRNSYQKRVFGFLSERLLTIWIMKNISKRELLELPVDFVDKVNKKYKMSLSMILKSIKHNVF